MKNRWSIGMSYRSSPHIHGSRSIGKRRKKREDMKSKIETQGSIGIENEVTEEEAEEADVVIFGGICLY